MSESADIVAFIRARLDEDESAATAAAGKLASWQAHRDGLYAINPDTGRRCLEHPASEPNPCDDEWLGELGDSREATAEDIAAHIARHDPARALREVEAKRAILAEYEQYLAESETPTEPDSHERWYVLGLGNAWLPVIRALAGIWSDDPDFHEGVVS